MSTGSLVRLGILALPISGLLGLVALIGRYGTPNASADPKAAAQTAASFSFFAIQFLGNVVGLTLLIFGVFALTVYLSNTRARRFAVAAMIFTILGIAPVLSALGVTTYALPVLGQAYLNGQQDVLTIINDIFNNPLAIIFYFVFLCYAVGFVLFGVAIWRSGVLRKGAAISLGIHAPLVSSFIRPEPSIGVIIGAVMFILGGTLITLDVFRGTPTESPPPE
jgi:hypothetical protein